MLQELIEEAGVAIVNKIPSMVKSHVALASYLVEDAFGSVRDISKNVISHYTVAGSTQVCGLLLPVFPPGFLSTLFLASFERVSTVFAVCSREAGHAKDR